ncbi:hypothetical protein MAR_020566 [Mya arenaria]|uniref:Uncharacterized protein n=1 Tax=Mya arenaria TaxID=6604 RepID=A0ABY7E5A5_MYAAR|nr:hypothetical protein MAR_020566 [Mya arenaria]
MDAFAIYTQEYVIHIHQITQETDERPTTGVKPLRSVHLHPAVRFRRYAYDDVWHSVIPEEPVHEPADPPWNVKPSEDVLMTGFFISTALHEALMLEYGRQQMGLLINQSRGQPTSGSSVGPVHSSITLLLMTPWKLKISGFLEHVVDQFKAGIENLVVIVSVKPADPGFYIRL